MNRTTGLALVAYLSQHDARNKSNEILIGTAAFAVIGAFGLFVSTLMIGLISRRISQCVAAVRKGECLAEWSYRPEECEAFQVTESPQLIRDYRSTVAIPFLIGTPIGLVLLAIQLCSGDKPDIRGLILTMIGIGLFVIVVLATAYYTRVIRRRASGRAQMTSPPGSFLHRDFGYANDEFLFGFFNQQLIDVQFIPGPPSQIGFAIRNIAPRVGEIIETRRVLVPSGQDKMAHEVISILREAWELPEQ